MYVVQLYHTIPWFVMVNPTVSTCMLYSYKFVTTHYNQNFGQLRPLWPIILLFGQIWLELANGWFVLRFPYCSPDTVPFSPAHVPESQLDSPGQAAGPAGPPGPQPRSKK